MLILGSPFSFAPGTMMSAIERVELTSGLKLCLDASDLASYSGSGQSWLDTSGNGYDFFRGTTSASQATDPTFNGVAGAQSSSEYWSFDGGDWFTYDSANETWMQNIHKNNAKWAFAAWVYVTSISGSAMIMGTNDSLETAVGFQANIRSTGVLRMAVNKGGSPSAMTLDGTAVVSTGVWSFLAGQIDEAAGTGFVQLNSTQEDGVSTYTSPASSDATYTMQIGAAGNTFNPLENGSRLGSFAMWEGSIPTKPQMLALYNATKAKFGH